MTYSYNIPTASKEQLQIELLSFFDMPSEKLKATLPTIVHECKKSYDFRRNLKAATAAYIDRIKNVCEDTPELINQVESFALEFKKFYDKNGKIKSFSFRLPDSINIPPTVSRIKGECPKYGLDREQIHSTVNAGKYKNYIVPANDGFVYEIKYYDFKEKQEKKIYYIFRTSPEVVSIDVLLKIVLNTELTADIH